MSIPEPALQVSIRKVLPNIRSSLYKMASLHLPPAAADLVLEAVHVGTSPSDVAAGCLMI